MNKIKNNNKKKYYRTEFEYNINITFSLYYM